MSAACHTCGRDLTGQLGWVEDVKVIDIATGATSLKTRYTCDDCEAER